MQQYWISLVYVSTEIKYRCEEIQIGPRKIPGKVTLRQHEHKEAGSWPFEKDLLFMFLLFQSKLHTLKALQAPAPVAPVC